MKTRITILSFFCLFLSSCGGCSDIIVNLGAGYYYIGSGPGVITFSKIEDEPIIDEISVYPKVAKFHYDQEFILATQAPDRKAIMYQIDTPKPPLYEVHTEEQLEIQLDSLIQHDSYFKSIFANDTNYWIIDKTHHNVFGPYIEIDFKTKSKELNISKKLIKDFEEL